MKQFVRQAQPCFLRSTVVSMNLLWRQINCRSFSISYPRLAEPGSSNSLFKEANVVVDELLGGDESIRDAAIERELKDVEAAMPPLLRQHEEIVEAALALAAYANHETGSNCSRHQLIEDKICDVVELLFSEAPVPVHIITSALRKLALEECFGLNSAAKNEAEINLCKKMLQHIHVILEALIPAEIVAVYEWIDFYNLTNSIQMVNDEQRLFFDEVVTLILKPIMKYDEKSDHGKKFQKYLKKFSQDALTNTEQKMKQKNYFLSSSDERDAEIMLALQNIESNFETLFKDSTPFIHLLKHLNTIVLQTYMANLLLQTCCTFDIGFVEEADAEDQKNLTGLIDFNEFKDCLRQVVPAQVADEMCNKVIVAENERGCTNGPKLIYYWHLARIMLKGTVREV